MSQVQVYDVCFQIVRRAPQSSRTPYLYRREWRRGLVQAADLFAVNTVLNNDIPVLTSETVEVMAVQQIHAGTEGVGNVYT